MEAEGHSSRIYLATLHLLWGGGGAEEDAAHMRSIGEQSLQVVATLCARVEELMGDLHLRGIHELEECYFAFFLWSMGYLHKQKPNPRYIGSFVGC